LTFSSRGERAREPPFYLSKANSVPINSIDSILLIFKGNFFWLGKTRPPGSSAKRVRRFFFTNWLKPRFLTKTVDELVKKRLRTARSGEAVTAVVQCRGGALGPVSENL
jgi:hypothetical protein